MDGLCCAFGSLSVQEASFKDAAENSLFSVFRKDTLTLEMLEGLLKAGADINEVDPKDNKNFLQRLIVEGFPFEDNEGNEFRKIAEWLYSNGINPNHEDVEGRTAVHLAILEEEHELAAWLISKGANQAIGAIDNYKGKLNKGVQ